MTAQNYDESLRRLLVHEGGYTNHPSDPGGPTNFGITIADYRKYQKPGATAADVKAMTLAEAKTIYAARYWSSQRCSSLPPGVDYSIFDYGVNSGIGRSGKVLRRVVGLSDATSVVNAEVLAAVRKREPKLLVQAINDERLAFLRRLKTWPTFGKGWERRVKEVRAYSMTLADLKSPPAIAAPTAPKSAAESGKGMVPAPVGTKAVIKAGVPGAGAVAGATWFEWLLAHPFETGAIALGGAAVLGGGVYALNRWHHNRQEAPTPGFGAVPVAA